MAFIKHIELRSIMAIILVLSLILVSLSDVHSAAPPDECDKCGPTRVSRDS